MKDTDHETKRLHRQLVLIGAALADKKFRDNLTDGDFLEAAIAAAFNEIKSGDGKLMRLDDMLRNLGVTRNGKVLDSVLAAARADAEAERWRKTIDWAAKQTHMEQAATNEIKAKFRELLKDGADAEA